MSRRSKKRAETEDTSGAGQESADVPDQKELLSPSQSLKLNKKEIPPFGGGMKNSIGVEGRGKFSIGRNMAALVRLREGLSQACVRVQSFPKFTSNFHQATRTFLTKPPHWPALSEAVQRKPNGLCQDNIKAGHRSPFITEKMPSSETQDMPHSNRMRTTVLENYEIHGSLNRKENRIPEYL
ncbi:hypothetical protein TNCV_430061 [Trichonephila clavipes]|nr:hypothetical protein TNCV_430061 [Trichonephila clavipes]